MALLFISHKAEMFVQFVCFSDFFFLHVYRRMIKRETYCLSLVRKTTMYSPSGKLSSPIISGKDVSCHTTLPSDRTTDTSRTCMVLYEKER